MIEDVRIRNFRCLETVDLRACRRVNVIVGRNASGKTALLEALFLMAGPSPEVALRLKGWRGFSIPAAAGTFAQIDESLWGDLFFGYDKARTIEISANGSDNHTRSLTVSYSKIQESFVTHGANRPSLSGVIFKWTRFDLEEFLVRPEFTAGGYTFPGVDDQAFSATLFASTNPFHNQDNVNRFTELSKKRNDSNFIEAVRKEFNFIKDIDIQSYVGHAILHADIPSLPEKVPLMAVSSGVNKLSSILLALSMSERTVLCIDEIENGIHYSRLCSMWQAMFDLADRNHAQVFASTHSGECLDALAKAFEGRPDEMTLIRTEMEDNGSSFVEQFRGETAIKSIKAGEVR